jgi:hypothetical protein
MSTLPFHQNPATFSWQDRLEEAASEAEVVDISRDFIAGFTPVEMSLLPHECRPGKFFEANDVTSYAFTLVRHECGADAKTAELVHKLANFFSNASIRLSQVMARPNVCGDDPRQTA